MKPLSTMLKIMIERGRKLRIAMGVFSLLIPLLFYTDDILANDLNDGISTYMDDPIEKYDQLGDKSVNIKYIITKALNNKGWREDDLNINSVVVAPGANVGDIYNVHIGEKESETSPKKKDKKKKRKKKK